MSFVFVEMTEFMPDRGMLVIGRGRHYRKNRMDIWCTKEMLISIETH